MKEGVASIALLPCGSISGHFIQLPQSICYGLHGTGTSSIFGFCSIVCNKYFRKRWWKFDGTLRMHLCSEYVQVHWLMNSLRTWSDASSFIFFILSISLHIIDCVKKKLFLLYYAVVYVLFWQLSVETCKSFTKMKCSFATLVVTLLYFWEFLVLTCIYMHMCLSITVSIPTFNKCSCFYTHACVCCTAAIAESFDFFSQMDFLVSRSLVMYSVFDVWAFLLEMLAISSIGIWIVLGYE